MAQGLCQDFNQTLHARFYSILADTGAPPLEQETAAVLPSFQDHGHSNQPGQITENKLQKGSEKKERSKP